MKALRALFSSSTREELEAKQHYKELVTESRAPTLYTDFAIPDTLDGRFESIILFLFVEQIRLEQDTPESQKWLRLLHESFFEDMDRSLREGGVGDTGISKRVQKMAAALYGRLSHYSDSWENSAAFKETLKRNVYGTTADDVSDDAVSGLADFIITRINA